MGKLLRALSVIGMAGAVSIASAGCTVPQTSAVYEQPHAVDALQNTTTFVIDGEAPGVESIINRHITNYATIVADGLPVKVSKLYLPEGNSFVIGETSKMPPIAEATTQGGKRIYFAVTDQREIKLLESAGVGIDYYTKTPLPISEIWDGMAVTPKYAHKFEALLNATGHSLEELKSAARNADVQGDSVLEILNGLSSKGDVAFITENGIKITSPDKLNLLYTTSSADELVEMGKHVIELSKIPGKNTNIMLVKSADGTGITTYSLAGDEHYLARHFDVADLHLPSEAPVKSETVGQYTVKLFEENNKSVLYVLDSNGKMIDRRVVIDFAEEGAVESATRFSRFLAIGRNVAGILAPISDAATYALHYMAIRNFILNTWSGYPYADYKMDGQTVQSITDRVSLYTKTSDGFAKIFYPNRFDLGKSFSIGEFKSGSLVNIGELYNPFGSHDSNGETSHVLGELTGKSFDSRYPLFNSIYFVPAHETEFHIYLPNVPLRETGMSGDVHVTVPDISRPAGLFVLDTHLSAYYSNGRVILFHDRNGNGIWESGEEQLPQQFIYATPAGAFFVSAHSTESSGNTQHVAINKYPASEGGFSYSTLPKNLSNMDGFNYVEVVPLN